MTAKFHNVCQICLLQVLMALHGPCDDSKHGKQKSHGPSFACDSVGPLSLTSLKQKGFNSFRAF